MSPDTDGEEEEYLSADLYLDLAVTLYEAGATVQRVGDSVRWLAGSLGDENVHLAVGYEVIELSVHHRDHTESRLYVLRDPVRVNLSVLHQVSGILHRIPSYQGNIAAIREDLIGIRTRPIIYPVWVIIACTGIACAAFGWINHADLPALWVIWVSAVCGLSIRVRFGKDLNNLYLTTLMTALSGGLCAALLTPFSHTQTPQVALISSVLFLIPGAMLINGGLDIIRDHTSCGIARLTSVFTQISIISGALLIPLGMMTITLQPQPAGDIMILIPTMSLAAGIAACGFGVLFNTPVSVLAGCFICSFAARLVRETGIYAGADPFFSRFLGMCIATVIAAGIGRYAHVPEVLLSVIAGIPMVPGLAMIQGLQGLFTLAHSSTMQQEQVLMYAVQQILFAGVAVLALVGGIIFPIIMIARKNMRI
ncbi:MAG: threonine/serine exporter family protein [Methanospirillum sp.]|uniref:threonine/serine ThrE exporter family protein n=1 Tax=Methanospirillum sp. TaxID=45200 RepID=UPI00236F3073|nr:threonine/serine exporter family protein [Methanospirillum sp.]MDD1728714.1 threonine/serine exporter family protein [Methanospirillum sp.]